MAVDKEKLENALQMLPIQELRKIIDERELGVKSRSSDELIEAIISDKWTDDEFDQLLKRIGDIKRETEPLGYYIANIDSIEQLTNRPFHEQLTERLRSNPANFDEENNLTSEGFEINSHEADELKATYWTQTINYTLDPLGKLRPRKTLYDTGFRVDFDDDRVFIETDIYGKARGLVTALEDNGLHLKEVGHQSLTNKRANEKVEDFVEDLEQSLEDRNNNVQKQLSSLSFDIVEIDSVKILVDGAEIKDVRIDGRTNIFTHEDVDHFTSDRDGEIVQIEGEMYYEDNFFDFQAGYNENLGRLKVRKKGQAIGDIELVYDAYEFLYDRYEDHFINV